MDIKKLAVVVAGAAVLAVVFAGLRGWAGGADAADTTTVEVAVRDGAVVGGYRRVRVAKDGVVSLAVFGDVRDRVHVHGYDRYGDLEPERAARLEFRAGIAGSFDVELEERGILLVTLDVRP